MKELTDSSATLAYKLLLVSGLVGSIAAFFIWIYATSFVKPPLGVVLFYGCIFPALGFIVFGYFCPTRISWDEDSMTLKTLLMTRKVPWAKVKQAKLRNVLSLESSIKLDQPSFTVIETTHFLYRWYFVSRFMSGYIDMLQMLSKQQKLAPTL
jgi:hypothetical protein